MSIIGGLMEKPKSLSDKGLIWAIRAFLTDVFIAEGMTRRVGLSIERLSKIKNDRRTSI